MTNEVFDFRLVLVAPHLFQVWRHFRFALPRSALGDTQVSSGGTADSSGGAQSSTWLVRAGARSLAVDVEVSF